MNKARLLSSIFLMFFSIPSFSNEGGLQISSKYEEKIEFLNKLSERLSNELSLPIKRDGRAALSEHHESLAWLQSHSLTEEIEAFRPRDGLFLNTDTQKIAFSIHPDFRTVAIAHAAPLDCAAFYNDKKQLENLESNIKEMYFEYFQQLSGNLSLTNALNSKLIILNNGIRSAIDEFNRIYLLNYIQPNREIDYIWQMPSTSEIFKSLGIQDESDSYNLTAKILNYSIIFEGAVFSNLSFGDFKPHLAGSVDWSYTDGNQQSPLFCSQPMDINAEQKAILRIQLTPQQFCRQPLEHIGVQLDLEFRWTTRVLKSDLMRAECRLGDDCIFRKTETPRLDPHCMYDGCTSNPMNFHGKSEFLQRSPLNPKLRERRGISANVDIMDIGIDGFEEPQIFANSEKYIEFAHSKSMNGILNEYKNR